MSENYSKLSSNMAASVHLCAICLQPVSTEQIRKGMVSDLDATNTLPVIVHDECLEELRFNVDQELHEAGQRELHSLLTNLINSVERN